jgi:hypothetical protein
LQHRVEKILPVFEVPVKTSLGDPKIFSEDFHPHALSPVIGENLGGSRYPFMTVERSPRLVRWLWACLACLRNFVDHNARSFVCGKCVTLCAILISNDRLGKRQFIHFCHSERCEESLNSTI